MANLMMHFLNFLQIARRSDVTVQLRVAQQDTDDVPIGTYLWGRKKPWGPVKNGSTVLVLADIEAPGAR